MALNSDLTIILCGGRINHSNLPVSSNQSNALVPINGKPVISWILDDLLSRGIRNATVVLRAEEERFHSYLLRTWSKRMRLHLALLPREGTILQSLLSGFPEDRYSGRVRVILGDTLIRDTYEDSGDYVFVGRVDDSRRWCIAKTDEQGVIDELLDKQELPSGSHTALAGFYQFNDGAFLKECIVKAIDRKACELSGALDIYRLKYPIAVKEVKQWFDFGHIDNFVDARWRLIQPRYFNSLSFNPVLNTVTKISRNTEKLIDELNWYHNIPEKLKVLTPRLIEYSHQDGNLEITQEYYGYPTLAELYLYSELTIETWTSILRRVLQIHREFNRFSGPVDSLHVRRMYFDKTVERLKNLEESDRWWNDLLHKNVLIYNGQKLKNIPVLLPHIDREIVSISENVKGAIIHGDLCFSNILYDLNNQIVRLIDPRGSFGKKGIYGDPRYDVAKLRHSVSGLYDFITADLFEIEWLDDECRAEVFSGSLPGELTEKFDRLIVEDGYKLNEIKLIEGLLFLSMAPLHQDKPHRQRMMFLTGIKLLNEVLFNENRD